MKCVLYVAAVAGLCAAANADMIDFGGQTYETINWNSISLGDNSAEGTVGGVGVTFETVDMSSDSISENNFNGDAAFDALGFNGDMVESISIRGGATGSSVLTFDQSVGSVLILLGSPRDGSVGNQFGASIWDFADALSMDVIDSEGNPGLLLSAGNEVSNSNINFHRSGVIGVFTELTTLSWAQDTFQGLDKMEITFAVAPATIPAPASGLALLLPAAFAGRRRR